MLDADTDRSNVELRPLVEAGSHRSPEAEENRSARSPIEGTNRLISPAVIRFFPFVRRGGQAPECVCIQMTCFGMP